MKSKRKELAHIKAWRRQQAIDDTIGYVVVATVVVILCLAVDGQLNPIAPY